MYFYFIYFNGRIYFSKIVDLILELNGQDFKNKMCLYKIVALYNNYY